MNRHLLAVLIGATLCPGAPAREAAAEIKGFAPVSVSSANYRNTPREELERAIESGRAVLNPESPEVSPPAQPQHFIFMPGEIFESDLTYEQITALLTPALARKGFVNGADPQGVIREPAKISLILRVHYGTRTWRLPTVRTRDITWGDGLVPKPRGRGLHTLGADQVWDERAGGNDDAFTAISANSANTQSFGFGSGSSGGAGSGGAGAAAGAIMPGVGTAVGGGSVEYGATRDFHLIVVDAFDYAEVKDKGKAARRLWTTFIAAPKQRNEKFSDMADTLVRNAIAYFGETTPGLQVYNDVRAEVKIGEIVEVKDERK